jgi:hypothetical protein
MSKLKKKKKLNQTIYKIVRQLFQLGCPYGKNAYSDNLKSNSSHEKKKLRTCIGFIKLN